MTFVKDCATWGPYVDGRGYDTGLVFDGPVVFIDRRVGSMIAKMPVGRIASAERLNGKVRLTSDWRQAE